MTLTECSLDARPPSLLPLSPQAEGRQSEIRSSFDDDAAPLLESQHDQGPSDSGIGGGGGYDLEFVSGTIDRQRMPTFERILWRVLRGNLYMNYAEIDQLFVDPVTGTETRKNVFIIFAHGAELLTKIRKVAESMGGTLYPVDSNADKRNDALREVEGRLEDLNTVCWNTTQTRRVELSKIAEGLEAWRDAVQKEKAVFQTMNLLSYDSRRKTLVAEGWCPSRDITAIQLALRRATVSHRFSSSPSPLLDLDSPFFASLPDRRPPGRRSLRSCLSFERTRRRRRSTERPCSPRRSRPSSTRTVSPPTRRSTRDCSPSSRSRSCLPSCLETSDTASSPSPSERTCASGRRSSPKQDSEKSLRPSSCESSIGQYGQVSRVQKLILLSSAFLFVAVDTSSC